MKKVEQELAKKMRREGFSINEIAKKLSVAKGSVSIWVRDIPLSETKKVSLSKRSHSREAVEKRRISRLSREEASRSLVIQQAQEEVPSYKRDVLFFTGVSLYWAEGSKSRRGNVEFSNSDPRLIKIMMRFFHEICRVPDEKFRGHVYLHPHLNPKRAEEYWSEVSSIPLHQFFKTTQQHNRSSQGKKDSLPLGTFSINIGSTELFLKIRGWMEGVSMFLSPRKESNLH